MEGIVFKVFENAFKIVSYLVLAGCLVSVGADIQRLAFNSKTKGLTSMLKINQQLVGIKSGI